MLSNFKRKDCDVCGTEFAPTGGYQKRCKKGCAAVAEKAKAKILRQTPGYQARMKVLHQTSKRKAARKKYDQTPERRAARKKQRKQTDDAR